jgi:DNA-binding Xre family transcriptional regulator
MIRLRVREIAESKGVNMSQLARRADIGFSTVKRIWQDPYKHVTTDTLEHIAKALGVSSSDLLEDLPDET